MRVEIRRRPKRDGCGAEMFPRKRDGGDRSHPTGNVGNVGPDGSEAG